MRNILFTAVLGCFIASGLAQHESFQFTDSQGRCWSCASGQPCRPCSSIISPFPDRPSFPTSCPVPDCSDPAMRATLFPIANDPTGFYRCVLQGATWTPVRTDCQCSTFFDYEAGNCQSIWDWEPYCDILGEIPTPIPCEDPTTEPTTEPGTTEPATTPAPTTNQPCNPCMPCMPCMIWWMCQPCNQQCNNGCMG